MSKTKKDEIQTIDMAKYAHANATVEQCKGCKSEFLHDDGNRKCLKYAVPAAQWPRKNVRYLTENAVVRKRDDQGRAVGLEEKEIPIVNKICPMATHVKPFEIVRGDTKVRVGQGRTKQGGNK